MPLISTLDVRLWAGTEEGDDGPNQKFDATLRAVEDFVESYTNRSLQARTFFDDQEFCFLDGTGERWLYLPVHPVSYISSIHIDADRVFGSGTVLASADFYWYPKSGKVVSEGGNFLKGRRNIKVHYTAGYAPVVNNTHDSAVSTYPIPIDLKQVMVEMTVNSVKEGMTAIHTVQGQNVEQPLFVQMLSKNSFWKNTLDKYRDHGGALMGFYE